MAKKSLYQKFIDFKHRHSLSNENIAKIVTEYADSDLNFARSFFKQKYGISESTFYKVRDFAVICCLVDTKTCQRLQSKAAANYSSNNVQNSSTGSIAHFKDLLKMRQEYLDDFSAEEIQDIANKYVEGVSVDNIAIAYDTGSFAIRWLLKKGVIMLILDANIISQMRRLLGDRLNHLLEIRKANKTALLVCIEKEIDFLKMQIKYYKLYFRNSIDKPTLESLNDNLSQAIKMHKQAFQL